MDQAELLQLLKDNLTLENSTRSDMYDILPDEVTITIKFAGEVVAQTVINPLYAP
jgi:hypothetical protein